MRLYNSYATSIVLRRECCGLCSDHGSHGYVSGTSCKVLTSIMSCGRNYSLSLRDAEWSLWRRDASVMLRVMAISDIIAMWIISSVIVRVTDTVDGPC